MVSIPFSISASISRPKNSPLIEYSGIEGKSLAQAFGKTGRRESVCGWIVGCKNRLALRAKSGVFSFSRIQQKRYLILPFFCEKPIPRTKPRMFFPENTKVPTREESSIKNLPFLYYHKVFLRVKKGGKGLFLSKKEKSFEMGIKMLAKRKKV